MTFSKTTFLTLSLFAMIVSHAQAGTKIIGGQLVQRNDLIAKRTVALILGSNQGVGLCSGSIIDAKHILTAAHCVVGFTKGYVAFATTDVMSLLKTQNSPSLAPITSAKAMPGFPGPGQGGQGQEFPDFAIITFSGGLPFGYQPAKFLPAATIMQALRLNAPITLAGYGITARPAMGHEMMQMIPNFFHEIVAAPAPQPQPAKDTSGTLRRVNVVLGQISPNKIDLFMQGPDMHNACSGDSGGPSIYSAGNEDYVVGVASRANCSNMSIYSLVTQESVNAYVASTATF